MVKRKHPSFRLLAFTETFSETKTKNTQTLSGFLDEREAQTVFFFTGQDVKH